jgi:hypothetical protein
MYFPCEVSGHLRRELLVPDAAHCAQILRKEVATGGFRMTERQWTHTTRTGSWMDAAGTSAGIAATTAAGRV